VRLPAQLANQGNTAVNQSQRALRAQPDFTKSSLGKQTAQCVPQVRRQIPCLAIALCHVQNVRLVNSASNQHLCAICVQLDSTSRAAAERVVYLAQPASMLLRAAYHARTAQQGWQIQIQILLHRALPVATEHTLVKQSQYATSV